MWTITLSGMDKFRQFLCFKIKKVYPNEIQITIREKKPIAIIQNKKKKNTLQAKGT